MFGMYSSQKCIKKNVLKKCIENVLNNVLHSHSTVMYTIQKVMLDKYILHLIQYILSNKASQ